jgi:hypothetical protein
MVIPLCYNYPFGTSDHREHDRIGEELKHGGAVLKETN